MTAFTFDAEESDSILSEQILQAYSEIEGYEAEDVEADVVDLAALLIRRATERAKETP